MYAVFVFWVFTVDRAQKGALRYHGRMGLQLTDQQQKSSSGSGMIESIRGASLWFFTLFSNDEKTDPQLLWVLIAPEQLAKTEFQGFVLG